MNLHSLLTTLADRGVKLSINNDSLLIDAPKGVLSPELRESLAKHKTDLLSLLRHNSSINTQENTLPTIVPAPEQRYQPFPLTDMQHAFWVGRSGVIELGNVANHGYYEIESDGLDIEGLNWALQKLIVRHDMLRAVVLPNGQQQVLEEVPAYKIAVLDLRKQTQNTVIEQIELIRQRMSHQVLPTDQWPLFEIRATYLNGERVRLHISYDLQIFDAWSLLILFEEWYQIYQNPGVELPPLELSFRDYVLAEKALQNTDLYKRAQNYWFNRLDSLPPSPDLPLAKHPSEIKQQQCQRYNGRLEKAVWQQLKHRATQAGLTPSGVLIVAFAEILTIWSKRAQFTINLALFNRLPLHPQVNYILGDLSSVTLLAVDNSTSDSFGDRAIRIQQQLWQDLEHRCVSGVAVMRELARRQGTAPSAMPVVFTSTLGFSSRFSSLGQHTSTFSHFGELVYGISQASQVWMDIQVWEEKGALTFTWDVLAELFPEGMIDEMFGAYCTFIEQLAISESPWVATTQKLVSPTNNASVAAVADELLHTLFATQAPARRDAQAIVSSRRTLTYQQLYTLSNQLGHRLRRLGVRTNQLVAVVMEKGWEEIVAVLGILASGAAYVPIACDRSPERLQYILENSAAEIVLTQSWLHEQLNLPKHLVSLCIDSEDLANESSKPLQPLQTPDDLAYTIYTCGGTDAPQGVMIAHRGVVNAITQTNQTFNIKASDRLLALTALDRDLSVYDIFGTLTAGGTIVIPDAADKNNPAHWVNLIRQENITIWNSLPAQMEVLLNYVGNQTELFGRSLDKIFLGRDWIAPSLLRRLQALIDKNVRVVAVGGATETTIWNIWYEVKDIDPTAKSIPYGQAIANVQYYVFNQALVDCPTWVPGELYCSGLGLAKGYWRNDCQTRASFTIHPRTGERLYRTRDIGRYLPDGNLELLGRVNHQIRIGKYNIQPEEIELTLQQHPAVRSALVTAIEHQQNKQILVAYLVSAQKSAPAIQELTQFLQQKLPEYMLPSAFVFLDALPLLSNNKADRNTLPHPELHLDTDVPYVAPQTELEQIIATIWQEVLQLESVGIHHKFFEIGGNSLLITQVYQKLQQVLPNETEKPISLVELFKYSTVHSLAKYLKNHQETPNLIQTGQQEKEMKLGKSRIKQRLKKSQMLTNNG
ncbi:amino acid adenylation domain-containing protein [Chlorogloeopsis sp. ULAP02]|uniref:non-ribosomal peptide synthetase n=1 Tax=Chlorogloeopsis sp. ULAP02 TaxID=3107926 RepID=UPI003135252E